MSTILWAGVLLAALWAAHWGAEQFSKPLKKLRKQWGFSVAAGGAFVGLAAASPEIGINVTSALQGASDIGLGVMLGSNVLAIPIMVTTAYLATRKPDIPNHQGHEEHRREHFLKLDRTAVTVQALPYLAIVALAALLTPLRGREEGEEVEWKSKELWLAAAGIAAIAVGTFFAVRATDNIVSALGISRIVGRLFITTSVAIMPEVFATWFITRSGQITAGMTSIIGDHAVTMTIAFLPLALVSTSIEDFQLFWVNIVFVALMPML